MKFVKTAPGEQAYEEMWVAMLASFAKHLKEKGWFDICTIAMDERPMDVMQKTLKVIRKADPDFKVSLAGNYHAEIEPDLYDYCIVIGQNYPEDVRLRRKAEISALPIILAARKHTPIRLLSPTRPKLPG